MKKAIFSILKGDLARSGGMIFLASLSANIILFFANIFIADQLGAVDFGVFKVISYLFTFLPILMPPVNWMALHATGFSSLIFLSIILICS